MIVTLLILILLCIIFGRETVLGLICVALMGSVALAVICGCVALCIWLFVYVQHNPEVSVFVSLLIPVVYILWNRDHRRNLKS